MERIIKKKFNKKGYYFTLDAFFASIILIGGLLLISQNLVKEHPKESIEYFSVDLLSALSELRVDELNTTYVNNVLMSSPNTNLNLSVLEQIGTYWAANETNLSINLTRYLLRDLFPNNTGVRLVIESDTLFEKPLLPQRNLRASERMITGIMQGAPLKGSTSSAYLRKIEDKRTSSFAYFGGFVGQGNISVFLENIPSDVTPDDITRMTLELDAGGSFILKINGDTCGSFTPSTTNTNMSPDVWDVSECNNSIVAGRNNISLLFLGEINESYVAGGYLRVDYKTNEFQQNLSIGKKRYYFPGIEGIINLYDSIYVPGIINSWVINISFYNNYTTYLVIGNETIFEAEGKNYTQNVTYTRTGLSINPATIPIRLGTRNFSNITKVITGEAADTILVTDTSGSMAECGEYIEQLMCGYYCTWWWWRECPYPGTCNDEECGGCWIWSPYDHQVFNKTVCNRTKLQIAQEADKKAVSIILNASANKVGLVSYSTSVNDVTELTRDQAGLNSSIDSYTANGGTCTCCGINKAKDLLLESSQKKFMIVLSDGDPTYYCKNYSDYAGSGVWGGDTTGGSSSETDRNWSIWAGQEACNNNITVFTIGFGESMSPEGHETMRRTACNDSLYFNATNVSLLSEIYRNISEMILTYANYTSQTIIVEGNITYSRLNPYSYIELNYTPIIDEPQPNEISVEVQTEQFNNCTVNVNIPSGIRIADARVTSYSGPHWTKTLIINSDVVYNLSEYGDDYTLLGDPYLVQIPPLLLVNGTNTIYIYTGDEPSNSTGCSKNNTLIYTALVPSATARSEVVEHTDGCVWTIQFEDDTTSTKAIPSDYTGSKSCSYTEDNHSLEDGSYDPSDAYDIAVFSLLRTLDFDNNGKVFVNLDAEDIEIVITTVSSVPYLWGPTLVKARVWQ